MKWVTLGALVLCGLATTRLVYAEERTIKKYISEEQNSGFQVANMARIFSIRYEERESRSFKLIDQSLVTKNPDSEQQDVNLLSLNAKTGVISTTQKLDREELCQYAEECIIRIQAVMLPNDVFTMLHMDVIIEDVNDNAPEFPARKANISIFENEYQVGEAITVDQYKAVDKDIGENGEITYDLNENPYFAVASFTDESGVPHLQLRVLAQPDHEETPHIKLSLTAFDKGKNKRSDQIILNITIGDSNDNAPIFEQQEYVINLQENDGPPLTVATVHAEDKDDGNYGTVRYYIPSQQASLRTRDFGSKLFSINGISGEIMLNRKVDREIHDGLRLMIEAKDLDPIKPKVGKTWLQVHVEDVNDNAPTIKINFIVESRNLTGYIRESASIQTYIAYVKASDADEGVNGEVSTTVTTYGRYRSQKKLSKLSNHFVLAPDGLLATGTLLDRENFQFYVLEIKSCDGGQPPRCSAQNITIIILDENDNAPEFKNTVNNVMIAEDTEIGQRLLTVKATDHDAKHSPSLWKNKGGVIEDSRNGIVRYSIVKGNTEYFEIDRASGDIFLKKKLDHESSDEWRLIIEARDEGWNPSAKVNCTVIIRVSDVNDNLPVFIKPKSTGEKVYATILHEHVIMNVQATDSDAEPNSKVKYKIMEEDGQKVGTNATAGTLFIINPISGDLRLNFSRANLTGTLGPHEIVIEAVDSGRPPQSATTTLYIAVIAEQLPDPVIFAGLDVKYVYLAVALGVAICLLIIAIIVTIFCRRRKDRKMHTYNCRSAERKSKWISEPVELMTSRSESRYQVTGTLESLSPGNPETIIHINEKCLKSASQTSMKDKDQSNLITFRNATKSSTPVATLTSARAVDRDSGRGDSDSENGNYVQIDDPVNRNQAFHRLDERQPRYPSNHEDDESVRTSDLGPQCQADCRTKGHSDICWMPPPMPGQDSLKARSLKYGMTASAPRLDEPSYYDYDYASRKSEYPTLQMHHPSSRPQSRQAEYYKTMSFSPKSMGDPYHQSYDGQLEPIDEMAPLNQSVDTGEQLQYEADDVSAQTQLTLSVTPTPVRDDQDHFKNTASQSSMISNRDYCHNRHPWDSRLYLPPRVSRAPSIPNNFIEFSQNPGQCTPHIPRVPFLRHLSNSADQTMGYFGQPTRRAGSAVPFNHPTHINNPNYDYIPGTTEDPNRFSKR